MTTLANRYDIVFLFDVINGNPNGDPDAGNLPRLDPETNKGLVSDVCLKRKIRNYVELARAGKPGYAIYVQEGAILNERHREAYREVRPGDEKIAKAPKLNPRNDAEADRLTRFMCNNFFDVRTFGAVMGTDINCGQVRGPVQIAFARSCESVMPLEISITRMAATSEKEKEEREKAGGNDERTENRTMGRKHIVPYGLYRAHIFISAKLAERTGFNEDDRGLLFEALKSMFENDRSAARGEMASRKIVAFKHASALGNAPAHALFDRVVVRRKIGEDVYDLDSPRLDNLPPARRYADYEVTLDRKGLAEEGIEALDIL
jgi:CRISPR-associated protein Csd2